MDYITLTTAIQDWVQNTESTFVTQIPQMVKNVEKRIYREVNVPDSWKLDTSVAMVDGTATISVPSGFLTMRHLRITTSGSEKLLIQKDTSFIHEAYPVVATKGTPKYYAMRDDSTVLLGPTPDSNYTTEFDFFFFPTTIVTASTTWIGDNADSLLLYGSLVEAYTFLKGEQDLIDLYEKIFIRDLADLKNDNEGKMMVDVFRSSSIRRVAQ